MRNFDDRSTSDGVRDESIGPCTLARTIRWPVTQNWAWCSASSQTIQLICFHLQPRSPPVSMRTREIVGQLTAGWPSDDTFGAGVRTFNRNRDSIASRGT